MDSITKRRLIKNWRKYGGWILFWVGLVLLMVLIISQIDFSAPIALD